MPRSLSSPLARRLTLAWFVFALIALGIPGTDLPDAPTIHFDKLVHFALFLAGTLVALRGWPHRTGRVIILLLLFAPLAEVWQGILPTGRFADPFDAIANALGVLAGWLIVHLRRRRRVPV